MELIVEAARKMKVSPLKLFFQVASTQDPRHPAELAAKWHHDWLIENELPGIVEEVCKKILQRRRR